MLLPNKKQIFLRRDSLHFMAGCTWLFGESCAESACETWRTCIDGCLHLL